jgi:hypothetical protein
MQIISFTHPWVSLDEAAEAANTNINQGMVKTRLDIRSKTLPRGRKSHVTLCLRLEVIVWISLSLCIVSGNLERIRSTAIHAHRYWFIARHTNRPWRVGTDSDKSLTDGSLCQIKSFCWIESAFARISSGCSLTSCISAVRQASSPMIYVRRSQQPSGSCPILVRSNRSLGT